MIVGQSVESVEREVKRLGLDGWCTDCRAFGG